MGNVTFAQDEDSAPQVGVGEDPTMYPSKRPTTPYPSRSPRTSFPSKRPTAYPTKRNEVPSSYPSRISTTLYPSRSPKTAFPTMEPTFFPTSHLGRQKTQFPTGRRRAPKLPDFDQFG